MVESHNDDHVKKYIAGKSEKVVQEEMELMTMDDANDLLTNYEILRGNLETGSLFNQETTNTSTSSSSFSWEDQFNNPSMGESPSLQDQDSLHQWFDNVDAIFSWDSFDQLEANLFVLGK